MTLIFYWNWRSNKTRSYLLERFENNPATDKLEIRDRIGENLCENRHDRRRIHISTSDSSARKFFFFYQLLPYKLFVEQTLFDISRSFCKREKLAFFFVGIVSKIWQTRMWSRNRTKTMNRIQQCKNKHSSDTNIWSNCWIFRRKKCFICQNIRFGLLWKYSTLANHKRYP